MFIHNRACDVAANCKYYVMRSVIRSAVVDRAGTASHRRYRLTIVQHGDIAQRKNKQVDNNHSIRK
jgi:hypothetical protein